MGGSPAVSAAPGATSSPALRLSPVSAIPERLAVGGGTALFLDGLCSHSDGPVSALWVTVDGVEHPVMATGMPPPGAYEGTDYWWAVVPIAAVERPQLTRLRLRARTARGAEAFGELGVIELAPALEIADAAPAPRAHTKRGDEPERPLIAVCMATYEPPIDLFRRQIDSIRAQTHDNWVCVISDDDTSSDRLAEMRAVIGDDDRFSLSPGERRLGFYGNFERALALAPAEASYVALCDQDDRWYPDKLETLEAGLRDGAKLAYSDMRIVDTGGRVAFDTYWSYRRNNHTNFGSLLLANTITGAASLFTREVLEHALPFPPRYGAAYHDHWIALVAMALGKVAYVDRPLYDYVQHGGAVLGHARANGLGWRVPPPPGGRAGTRGIRAWVERMAPLRIPRGMRDFYFLHYCGTVITASVVDMRCGELMTAAKRRTVRRFLDPERAMAWLILRAPRRLTGKTETLRREQALLGGLAWRRYAELRKHGQAVGRRRAERGRASAAPAPALATAPSLTSSASATNGGPPGPDAGPWLVPILVDYFTRDGSTLLMRLLASSPQVAVEDQYPYERKYFGYLWRWSRMLERGVWPEEGWSPSALASISQERHQSLLGPPPWHPRLLMESSVGEESMSSRCFELAWSEFSRRAASATANGSGGATGVRYYAEKHLDTWLLDRGELPPFELLVLLRDPRDTYVSINAFNRMRGSDGFGRNRARSDREHLDHLIARQRERLRWVAQLLQGDERSVVRYDELVLDTEAVARGIERRLGIELDVEATLGDAHMRKAHVSASSPESSVGRWRRELDAETAEQFRRELGDELEAVGFEV